MIKEKYKYFDIQVNGYTGIDFNSTDLTIDQLLYVSGKLVEDNVEGILATIITDDYDRMVRKIENLAFLIGQNDNVKSLFKGIHIEGPFLNPEKGFHGAHPRDYIIRPDIYKMKRLIDAGDGLIKLVTLAPEYDKDFKVIKFLTNENIIVSAGHSNASMKDLQGAIDAGLKMFTHLGNGSPNLLARHDNIINRVLSLSDKLFVCFIADGIHIPNFALKNYLKITGYDKSIIVTDCMAAASAPPGKYTVSHIQVEVGVDRIVREVGKNNLAGSAITMLDAENFLINELGVSVENCKKVLSANARKLFNF